MKTLLKIVFLILILDGSSAKSKTTAPRNDLYILVTTVQSEHSKDSNSETTTLTVSGNTLVYKQARTGAHSRQHALVEKDFTVTVADKDRLARILNDRHLLVTKTLSKPSESTGRSDYRSISISIRSKFKGKGGSISIDGPVSSAAIKKEPLYEDSLILLKELYLIINRTDPLLRFREFME